MKRDHHQRPATPEETKMATEQGADGLLDPADDKTLLTLEEAAAALGYGDYSMLRRAATADPPALRTIVKGKRFRMTTPAWVVVWHTTLRKGKYPRGVPRFISQSQDTGDAAAH